MRDLTTRTKGVAVRILKGWLALWCVALGHLGMAQLTLAECPKCSTLEWESCCKGHACCDNSLSELSFFWGIDGSKQPQDYGVNANLGTRLRATWSAPLNADLGLGYQLGTAVDVSDNAVQVFELLGEDTTRFQNHSTVGIFQRLDRVAWGVVFDHLYQDGFDSVSLGQWRGRVSYRATECSEVGATVRLRSFGDTAEFLGTPVRLRTIDQYSLYCRQYFSTGVQITGWVGLADEHGESNAVTGPAASHENALVFGADVLAPLNDSFAIYGETNLMLPADTGTVDAFLGIAWYVRGNAKSARRGAFSPLLPVASDTTFSVDLLP